LKEEYIMKIVTKIIGVGEEYRPCEHTTGVWKEEDGICVEYQDGERKCFYISQMNFTGPERTFDVPEPSIEMVMIGEEALDNQLTLRCGWTWEDQEVEAWPSEKQHELPARAVFKAMLKAAPANFFESLKK
jgi:hypothetical protein